MLNLVFKLAADFSFSRAKAHQSPNYMGIDISNQKVEYLHWFKQGARHQKGIERLFEL